MTKESVSPSELYKHFIDGDQNAGRELIAILHQDHWAMRKEAYSFLAQTAQTGLDLIEKIIKEEGEVEKVQNLCYWASQLCFETGLVTIPLLNLFFENGNNHVKKQILNRMEERNMVTSWSFLFAVLQDSSWEIREKASQLFVLSGEECIEFLESQFETASSHQRFWTFRIFAKILGSGAVKYFSKFIKMNPQEEQLQVYAVSNLGEIQDNRVLKTLLNFLKSASFLIQEEVVRALKKLVPGLKKDFMDLLLQNLASSETEALLKACSFHLDDELLKELKFLFFHENYQTRYLALSHLSNFPSQITASILISLFGDERWAIRKLAMDKLVQLKSYAITPLLNSLENPDDDKVFWSLRSLKEIGEETTLCAISALLEHKNKGLRLLAIEVIASFDSEDACTILRDSFANSCWEVRQRAGELLSSKKHPPIAVLLEGMISINEHLRFWSSRTLEDLDMPGASHLIEIIRMNHQSPTLFLRELKIVPVQILAKELSLKNPDLGKIEEILRDLKQTKERPQTPLHPTSSDFHPDDDLKAQSEFNYPLNLEELLEQGYNLQASDIHFKIFHPPVIRVNGKLSPLKLPPLNPDLIKHFIRELVPDRLISRLSTGSQLDLSFHSKRGIRLRINIYRMIHGYEIAARFITDRIPTFESLNLPTGILQKICTMENGLVIITGPTGSGKSSTIAAMINYVNLLTQKHIITIEDPIEFLHPSRLSYISQREVLRDVPSYPVGIRATLREDPDIILIGELRDQESVETALTLAGTGHLVFTTLHAPTCTTAVEQLMDFFSSDHQEHVRKQIAFNLRAIVSQRLLRHKNGKTRIPVCETMLTSPAVKNVIRDGKTEQIPTLIETSKKDGMISLDQALKNILQKEWVSIEEVWPHVTDPKTFRP